MRGYIGAVTGSTASLIILAATGDPLPGAAYTIAIAVLAVTVAIAAALTCRATRSARCRPRRATTNRRQAPALQELFTAAGLTAAIRPDPDDDRRGTAVAGVQSR